MNMTWLLIPAAIAVGSAAVRDGTFWLASTMAPPILEGSASYDRDVQPGETIVLDWSIRKTVECDGQASRVWSGENGFYMAEGWRPAAIPPSADFRDYSIPTEVPPTAPPGDLYLTIRAEYFCPQRTFRAEIGPVALTVVDPAEP